MSRTRLIVSAIFVVILGLLAAPATWAGGLKTGTSVSVVSAGGDAVLLVDLDGDSKNDLVVANCTTGRVRIFQGDGAGGFTAKTNILIGLGVCPQALAYGKLTGGANPDIVIGDNTGKITVLENGGAFSFTVVSTTLAGANVTGVAVADFDGDNKQDVVASSNESPGKVYLLLGNGTAPWAPSATTSYTVGTTPSSIVASDFNNDGEPDLAVTNAGDSTVSILTNNTSGWPTTPVTFSTATSTVASTPTAIAAGIVGTSGKPDLVVGANGASKVSVLLNDGSGGFPATSTDYSVRNASTGIGLGDFTADGKNDIVVSASDGAEILFNNGSGTGFTLSPDVFAAGTTPSGISVNTINGDSLADVAIVNNGSTTTSILLGTPFYAITPTPVSAVEGVQFTGTSLMTFKYDGASPTFSASVDNWGDTLSDTCPTNCSVTGPNGSGVYTLQGDHKYSDPGAEGTKNIFLTVTDTAASPNQAIAITASSTTTTTPARLQATVTDAPLSPAATPDLPGASVPHTYTNVVVANFTDQNDTALNTDFGSSIDWGDGSPLDICAGPSCPNISGGAGSYAVKGTHTYSSVGNFTILTTITDVEGGSTKTTAVTIHASVGSITGTPVTFNVTEGKQFTGVTLATFSSSRGGALSSEFTAVVKDWGDGLGAVNDAQTVTGTGPFNVASVATTKYKNVGTYSPVVIEVTDTIDGSVTTINSTANVTDGVLTITTNNQTITEGATTAAVGSFTDEDTLTSASDYTVTIDWGDCGNVTNTLPGACTYVSATNVTGSNGSFNVNDTHTYKEEGSYTVNLKVLDNDSLTKGPTAGTITVNDATLNVPVVSAVAGGGSGPGGELIAGVDDWNSGLTLTLATFTDNYVNPTASEPPASDFTALITWGDGSTTNCPAAGPPPAATCQITSTAPGQFKIVANHIFTKAKGDLSAITVKVTDTGGAPAQTGTGTAATVGTLFNPVPVNVSATEGTVFNGMVGKFDLGLAGDTVTATITWDDPNCNNAAVDPNLHCTSAGTIAPVSGTTYSVSGSHTYAEERSPAITVAVSDTTVTGGDSLNIGGGVNTVGEAPLATPNPLIVLGAVEETASTTAPPTINGQTVLVFTDGNSLAAACPGVGCDFAATIHWGDGTSSAGTITGPQGGPYTVTGSHNYTEGGLDPLNPGPNPGQCTAGSPALCHITVDVTDDGAATTITGYHSADAPVNDAPLGTVTVNTPTAANDLNGVSSVAPNPIKIVANVDTWNGTIATFTDTNLGALASDFTAVIDWGDGPSGTNPLNCPAVNCIISSTGPGQFKIVASHVFTKAGTALNAGGVTVTVSDNGGAAPINNSSGSRPDVTSLYQPVAAAIAPLEGVSFTSGVGTFAATTGSVAFTINVNWGDGTTNAQPATGGPTWTVNGTHAYAEETSHNAACGNAPCPLTVTIADPADGSTLTITGGTATIADAPLTAAGVGSLGLVTESNAQQVPNNTVLMKFTDQNWNAPANDFVATVDWGDGTAIAAGAVNDLGCVTTSSPGSAATPCVLGAFHLFSVTAGHKYTEGGKDAGGSCSVANPSTCQIAVTVTDEGSSIASISGAATTIQVQDAALSNPSGVALTPASLNVTNVALGSFQDGNSAATTSDFLVTINWGDTTSSAGAVTGPVGGPFTVTGTHTYATTGTLFNVTITVNDVGGAGPLTINSTILTPATAGLDFNGTASPPSSAILPGQSVDAVVTLSPTNGFNTPVTFTGCLVTDTSNNPVAGTNISCSFNPTSVPDVNTIHTVHMIVQTFSGTAMMNAPQRPGQNNPVQLAMLLPGFVGLFGVVLVGGKRKNVRARLALWFLAGLLLLALFAAGCGGGAPQITPGPGGNGTPAGTYRVHALMSGTANPPDIFVTITVQ